MSSLCRLGHHQLGGQLEQCTVEISIMHTVRRRQILCIIRIMQYQIWYVLHEIDGLKLTTSPKPLSQSSIRWSKCKES